ncbi:FAD-dependent oxidoreductase [Prauserella marina]|nr:NAD(P)/FAD-dependent oxidoreductase [Prauserella marina]ASR39299.1 FAD-dependent oxidoreductase [Prauserella marina]
MEQVIVIGAGQSGIAVAGALLRRGLRPLVLTADAEPAGAWPHYYDSLKVFTPAWFNALPGQPFPGDPHRYPHRDEVADYLRSGAARLDCEIRTGQLVTEVTRQDSGYRVLTADGAELRALAVVAASGQFTNPHRPPLPALAGYAGTVLHSADYRGPEPFAGKRVVVVGAGNSAVQIAVELALRAEGAEVTLASRGPVHYATNEPVPGGSRFWPVLAAAAKLPVGRFLKPGSIPVIDTDGYREAIEAGKPERREMFTGSRGTKLEWKGRAADDVDVVLLATGYRPALDYLRPLGALGADGLPAHRNGLSKTHRGLAFVGLDYQRTILSATLHGVGADAAYVAKRLRPARPPR